MPLPKEITPCPIKEAAVEIRFSSLVHPDTILGVVHSALKDKYPHIEGLPILQIPEMLRLNNPDLAHQPSYRLKGENFLAQVGPKVFSISIVDSYPGWPVFLTEILDTFQRIKGLELVEQIERVGLRYIDFFDNNIYQHIKLNLAIYEEDAVTDETFVRTKLRRGQFHSLLQIGNQTRLTTGDGQTKVGSIIDVDTFKLDDFEFFFNNMEELLQAAHNIQKELFFNLLTDEFLATLNPVYEEE